MNSIPLSKKAEFELKDLLWDDDRGPLENIFVWINRFAFYWLGGFGKIVILALTFLGLDLSNFGKMLDQHFGFQDFDDVLSAGQDKIADVATDTIWSQVGQKFEELGAESASIIALKKEAGPIDWLTARRMRRVFLSSGGKFALTAGIGGLIGLAFKLIKYPALLLGEQVGKDEVPDERLKTLPSKLKPTTNYRAKLERAVDNILQ